MISHQTRLTNTCRTAVRGLELLSLSTPPFICHLTLSCDGMNTPLFNHVCVTVCLSTPLLKCPFEKGLCPVPWGGWFQNDLSITPSLCVAAGDVQHASERMRGVPEP